jgi:glutamate synthase domain-containing protein 3
MIAEGCIMLRACHRDTCKPGVATQRPNLRANFTGTPEGVARYFTFVADDVRRRLAALGARSLDELIGRVELVSQRVTGDDRVDSFDLTWLLTPPDQGSGARHFVERVSLQDPRTTLGDQLLADAFRAVWDGDDIRIESPIVNADRSVGASLSGALALEFGGDGPRGSATISLTGSAGQSFGAFVGAGVHLDLYGEANDYVGKGLSGGRITIRPPTDDALEAAGRDSGSSTVLAGNTCLYGATGGEVFIAGAAGERFAVRNSGALAVVEAIGDHGAEYQTGGTVVVLGRIGHNLGAGMTGGEVFVWDPDAERVLTRVNTTLVSVVRPGYEALVSLRWLVERHVELTNSRRGAQLLAHWETTDDELWHIVPRERAAALARLDASRVVTA